MSSSHSNTKNADIEFAGNDKLLLIAACFLLLVQHSFAQPIAIKTSTTSSTASTTVRQNITTQKKSNSDQLADNVNEFLTLGGMTGRDVGRNWLPLILFTVGGALLLICLIVALILCICIRRRKAKRAAAAKLALEASTHTAREPEKTAKSWSEGSTKDDSESIKGTVPDTIKTKETADREKSLQEAKKMKEEEEADVKSGAQDRVDSVYCTGY